MKSIFVFAICILVASASPIFHHHIVATVPDTVSSPLLVKTEGQAPASTTHAVHAKVIPQIVSYNVPAPIVSAPLISSPVISAYNVPAPFVSHFALSILMSI
jgi:hypothetical protein